MNEEQKATLRAVLRTLDTVPVCGMENLDRLLGCMQVLRALAEESSGQEKEV